MSEEQTRKKLKKIEESKHQNGKAASRDVALVTTIETPAPKNPVINNLSQKASDERTRRASDTVASRIAGDRRRNRPQAIEKAPAGTRTRMLKIIYEHKAKFQEQRQRSFLFKAILVTVLTASGVTAVMSSWTFIRETSEEIASVLDLDVWWTKVSTGRKSAGIPIPPPQPVYLEKAFKKVDKKIAVKKPQKVAVAKPRKRAEKAKKSAAVTRKSR